MTSDESPDSGEENDVQPIPEELQDISTEELVGADYEAVPPTATENDEDDRWGHRDVAAFNPPGRTRHDDSINASSEDPGGDAHEDAYSTGYDSPMATRIGDEDDSDDEAERLRELHDGRHHSDGDLSTRQSQWDKKRVAEAICSSLPLAQHESDKVLSVVESLDFSKFGQQKALERVTLGAVAVVVDERHRQHDDVDGDIISFTDEYREMCDSLDLSMSDLATIKRIVREAVDGGDATVWQREPRRDTHLPEPTPVDEYPDEYWDERHSEYWVRNAKAWSRVHDEFKGAIPAEYRTLIENLRKWEPWADEEDSGDHERDAESTSEELTNGDGIEELLDEIEADLNDRSSDEMNDESAE
jgi:hypothetical protein